MSVVGMMDDVTIVITSYQQVEYLPAAIASAQRQTTACRVVVVDDGSEDGSAEVAKTLDVEVVRLPHRGALATFRLAVDTVRTPFYVLLNADDELDPCYVELTRPKADNPSVGFVYTGFRYAGIESGATSVPEFDLDTLKWGNYVHAASLTRKAAYESVGGFDARFAGHHEDWALWVAIARGGWRGAVVDRPLLRYRRHASGSRNPDQVRDVERARWWLARRDPHLYGLRGLTRLFLSSVKLRVTGR